MLPASTKIGKAIAAFPDVCKTPSPGGPVPIPYPNQGMAGQAKTAGKTAASGFKSTASLRQVSALSTGAAGSMSVQDVRAHLQRLHGQIMVLPAGNPNRWHELVDSYVVATAQLYIALANPS